VNLTSGHAKTGFTEFGGPISIAAGCEFRMGYPPLPSAAGNDDVRIAQGVHGSDVIVGEGKAVFGPGCVVHVGAGNPATEMVTFQNVDDYSSKLYGDGNFTIRGTYNWYGDGTPAAGFWDQGGTAQVGTPTNTTATLNFKADRHDIQRVLTNYGVMNWVRLTIPLLSDTPPSSAEIVLFGPGTIYNKGGANFNITSNGPRTQKLKANVERTFVNYGTLTTTNDRPDPGRGIVGGSIEIDFYDQDEEVRGGTTFKGKHEHKGKAVINKKELLAAGVQNINPDALLVVLGDVEQTGGDLVASSADVQVAGTYRQSAGALVGGASLVAMATTYEFQGGTADFSGTRNGESLVADSIHQTGGTLVMHYTSALDVTGAFDQEAGTVQIDMSGATVGGGWGIGQAGSLYASRAGIAGNLSNNGLVELGLITPPPSQTYADTLSITGDYSQSGTGRLTMDIVTYPNWMVDSLSISGHAAFGGTFTLRAPAGFNPGPMTIGLISYQTHSGEFATYVLPPGNWIEVYTENPPNGPGGFQIHQPYGPPYYP
jgi:hypothetical protein